MQGKRKLLIVDDQPINLAVLEKLLREEYRLVFARNGREAVRILEQEGNSISAVLLDLIMPVMDGYEALRCIRAQQKLSTIPVIVTTQATGQEHELRALALGASDFVTKPYNPQILRHRLNNLILMHEAMRTVRIVERDTLTGLLNEAAFFELSARRLAEDPNQGYDIVALDLERFSLINDSFGVAQGNRLLQYAANCLHDRVPDTKGECARTGDRFFVLLARTANSVQELCHTLTQALAQYPLDRRVTVKFGVYEVENRSLSIQTMCEAAVQALKKAKNQYDLSCCYYDKAIRRQVVFEQRLIADMAVALDREEFEIYFQPKYRTQDGELGGAEALVRWNHPEYGLLSPGGFVPVFEQNGMITEMDKYVWRHTCEHISRWQRQNKSCVPISVNISRKDIYDASLPEILGDIIKTCEIEPAALRLEITESACSKDPKQLIATLHRLRQMGFSIDMDDFGSGYSSLNALAELPVDALKLDMRFIQLYNERNKSGSIIRFVVELAQKLELSVVVEGAETQKQFDFLRGVGCDLIQGDFCSPPLRADAFGALLKTNQ